MKILYIAFACNPYAGSEAQCGWAWPMAMRNYADVSVITRTENENAIKKYLRENKIENIKVYYHDIPEKINIYQKKGKLYHGYYLLWQKTLIKCVKKLHNNYKYDYIHHVTLGDFRSVNNFGKISAKFIFGPVGGAQITPRVFKDYVRSDIKIEYRRELINKLITYFPSYRRALNSAEWIFAANKETLKYLKKMVKDTSKCKLLTENGVLREKIGTINKPSTSKVKLLWSGRMINKKGLSFLIDILPMVKTRNEYILTLVGDGPEKKKLEKRVEELKIKDKVCFKGKVSYDEMQKMYRDSDIFLFPSFRETTGTVLFEAMSNAIPVITFNQNGADLLIDETCGIKIDIYQPITDIRNDFVKAIEKLVDSPEERKELGEKAYSKILNQYLWEKKCKLFFDEYLSI